MRKKKNRKKERFLWFKKLGTGNAHAEKSRLEAFLDAVPGEYCGWAPDGTIAYSKNFCKLLSLTKIGDIHDIQNSLSPADAAALEGMHIRLLEDGEAFTLNVCTSDKAKTLKLSGSRGKDLEGQEQFDILWLEDITAAQSQQKHLETCQNELENERDLLQAALDQLPTPLWMRNHQTDITWCNRAYAEIFDTSPATVIAEQRELVFKIVKTAKISKTTPKNGKEPGKKLAQAVLQSHHKERAQGYIILEGNRHLMDVHEIPLPSAQMTLGVARDISYEEKLETEHKRYMTANNELLEQLGTAIGFFDSAQKLAFYNSAFSELWHLEEAYLNTSPKLGDVMEKLRESRRLPEQADFRKFKQSWTGMFTRLITPHDETLYLPDGCALRMLVVPHVMGGLMMTFEDVSSHLELESSYNTLVAVQKETLDNLAEGVSVFGGDGRLKLWNPSFAWLWNFNPEELEGEPHVTRLAEKMKGRFTEKNWEKSKNVIMTQSLDRNVHEGKMKCSDGNLIAYSTVPLPDGGVLVTHIDITDKIKVERALREKNLALEEAERVKLDFLANVSYQLRTPLNAMMGFAEILDNEYFGKLNEKQKEYTKGMQEAGERLLSLINNILDLSTIEAGYMQIHCDKVSIRDILENLFDLTEEWARKERLTIHLECPKNIGSIIADERRLKQVLLNLMRNAITFTPEKGTIILKARRSKNHMIISISDTGSGIPKEDQARVFEPFERTQSASQGGGGAGLGLTLVKNIVALHEGTIELESAKGKGTLVTIKLPLKLPLKVSPDKTQK